MIFKEIDNIRDVGVICHYFASALNNPRAQIQLIPLKRNRSGPSVRSSRKKAV